MKDRVKALDLLARYQKRTGQPVTGKHLPEYTDTAILEAAKLEAFRARRDFYFRIPGPHEPEPRWVLEDQLLDPGSEKMLLEQQKDKLRSLLGAVSMARIRVGEPH